MRHQPEAERYHWERVEPRYVPFWPPATRPRAVWNSWRVTSPGAAPTAGHSTYPHGFSDPEVSKPPVDPYLPRGRVTDAAEGVKGRWLRVGRAPPVAVGRWAASAGGAWAVGERRRANTTTRPRPARESVFTRTQRANSTHP